jgi:hypothetical protein
MAPGDVRVWREALRLGLVKADRFEYDVRLGGAGADLVEREHPHLRMWETLLKKRVDVVAWSGSHATIIEVKPVASFSALGQAVGYRFLWGRERAGRGGFRVAVVCAIVDPDLAPVFRLQQVDLVVLPADLVDQVLTRSRGAVQG